MRTKTSYKDCHPLFGTAGEQAVSPFLSLVEEFRCGDGPAWPDRFGTAVRNWARGATRLPLRTISLFTGAGGLDIGFHDAGFDILEMVEINWNYAKTLEINAAPQGYFGHGCVRTIDIHQYDPRPVAEEGDIDLVIGGPPCQTFSAAGRRAAGVLGTTEKRGRLFQEYVRILRILRPRAFLFENVYGITGAEGGAAWERIRDAFASAGYRLWHRILDSADYGVPQHRERMIVVGVRDGEFRFPLPTHGPDSIGHVPFFTAKDAIAGAPLGADVLPLLVNGRYGSLLTEVPPGLNYSFFTEKMGHPRPLFAWRSKFSDFLYKADPHWPVRTVKAFCGKYTGPFHWENRRFTIDEFKRLQTFPDSYSIAGSRGVVLQQIGNSVPPQMARVLALAVLDQVFGVHLPIPQALLEETAVLGFRTRKRDFGLEYERRAREAVAALKNHRRAQSVPDREYTCDIDDDFRLTRSVAGDPVKVLVSPRHGRLDIRVIHGRGKSAAFSIDVSPSNDKPWALPVHSVRICGNQTDRKCFLAGWKALEAWMAGSHLKDDMVQLCGYYAYAPAIRCRMSFANGDGDEGGAWGILRSIVAGVGVRVVQAANTLADTLGVAVSRLPRLLVQLRQLGYEVRSHRTNPQLEPGTFLIPYAFPTFTHRSVQLHKELF